MNIQKFIGFLESLSTPENRVLVESVAAGFLTCFESEIEITTKTDGKLPTIFTSSELLDPRNQNWKVDAVNFAVSEFTKPGKILKPSEVRVLLNSTAMLIIDKTEILYLNEYQAWKDLKERYLIANPSAKAEDEKREKWRKALREMDPETTHDKSVGTLSMEEMKKRSDEALAKRETDKFSDLNKLFR